MTNLNKIPSNIYALFADGQRMTGTYGQFYFDRASARDARAKARASKKWNGYNISLAKVSVGKEWMPTH